LDLIIRNATLIDGTGAAPFVGDLGIENGVIACIGSAAERGSQEIDGTGLMVAPGFIDPHCHYDAQLFWDAQVMPSSAHGVTTILNGNCGFTLAPIRNAGEDADYIRRMMAMVEGIPLSALEQCSDWSWHSFGDYLSNFDGKIAVNAGFMIGHSALRRYVMGSEAVERTASEGEIKEMASLLAESIAAGGLGLSTSRASSHSDGDGNPVPSRLASVQEVLDLCRVVGQYPGTNLEAIVQGTLSGFTEDEIKLLAEMSTTANRVLNWNLLSVRSEDPAAAEANLRPSRWARGVGARVVALMMPVPAETTVGLGFFCSLWHIPGWSDVLALPKAERAAKLSSSEVRANLLRQGQEGPTAFRRLVNFETYVIGDTAAPANAGLHGRLVKDVAEERGIDSFACVVDISIAEDFDVIFWPQRQSDSDAAWDIRRKLWAEPDVLLGGSDAGAHVDRLLGSSYPSRFLADCINGRQLVPVETAVHLMTGVPAEFFGLSGRGRLQLGYHADLVVFDPSRIGSAPVERVHDLPGGGMRLKADAVGIERVLVNGKEIMVGGQGTGAAAGRVLRSGIDTHTVGLTA
jgi:N-acyl-D-aspartate/D-glutamate deacylase